MGSSKTAFYSNVEGEKNRGTQSNTVSFIPFRTAAVSSCGIKVPPVRKGFKKNTKIVSK